MYEAEITFNLFSDDEFTWYGTYPTLQGAVDYIEREAAGCGNVRAFINNTRVTVLNGYVLDGQGQRFCTNEQWHERFAPADERILPRAPTNTSKSAFDILLDALKPPTREQVELLMGTSINPVTLKDIGKPV